MKPLALWDAWLRRAGSVEISRDEWAVTCAKLGGHEGYTDNRDLIRRGFADNELLMLWFTSRDSDDPDIQEVHKFTWDEMRSRAALSVPQVA